MALPGSSDGIGTRRGFSSPERVAVDAAGYILCRRHGGNNTFRKVSAIRRCQHTWGLAGQSGQIDGEGAQARFYCGRPDRRDSAGNVLRSRIREWHIRKSVPEGTVSLLADRPGILDGLTPKGDNRHFRHPWSVAVDNRARLCAIRITSSVRQITPDGRVSTIAGPGPACQVLLTANRDAARFRDPHGIAVDYFGNVYVADTANQAVRKFRPPAK